MIWVSSQETKQQSKQWRAYTCIAGIRKSWRLCGAERRQGFLSPFYCSLGPWLKGKSWKFICDWIETENSGEIYLQEMYVYVWSGVSSGWNLRQWRHYLSLGLGHASLPSRNIFYIPKGENPQSFPRTICLHSRISFFPLLFPKRRRSAVPSLLESYFWGFLPVFTPCCCSNKLPQT